MRILVIPDIHLKPWIFVEASELLKKKEADRAVCLMDIADDWDQEMNLDLYARTYDAAIRFSKEYPDTLWCLGNHDVCYLWNQRESGYSDIVRPMVCEKIRILKENLPEEGSIAFVHRIDDVIFSHGGVSDRFVDEYIPETIRDKVDTVIKRINSYGREEMWRSISPIWCRPQYTGETMYGSGNLLQVVGHTPVQEIQKEGSVISCDVFSTYRDHTPIGTREFLILDTLSWEYFGVRGV